MQDNALMLKPINDLLDKEFYIPAYQRGYRWTKRQVTDLLEDIKEFQQQVENSTNAKDKFYCLQPIVVKEHGDKWEIVDGQQRLTTIHIILTCLKEILPLVGKSRYQISYETRTDSSNFLSNINEDQAEDNIDFFHIVEAKKAVDEWFKDKGNYRIQLIQTLLNENEIGKNVKVIWYELGEHENATEVFTRLNMGKILLVNAELVKALFLKSSNFIDNNQSIKEQNKSIRLEQLKISQEWDSIEKSLQDDAFWYFISNKNIKTNRIEFILQLRALEFKNSQNIIDNDKFKTFIQFNKWFDNDQVDISNEWLKVKKIFMTLEEWFNDRTLFHLIGYLVSQNISISEVFKLSSNSKGKKDFYQQLSKRILHLIFDVKIDNVLSHSNLRNTVDNYLAELNYETSTTNHLRQILLLFNIASLLSNPDSNARFQFEKFKLDQWDIEHIRSVSSEMPESKDKQEQWLEQVIEYISDNNTLAEPDLLPPNDLAEAQLIKTQAINLCSISFTKDQFKDIYDRVIKLYDPNSNDEVDSSIGNLTLLDSSTNRSYKNAVFPIKRKRIIELDKQATYVPLCTKNVFLKYYSKNVDKMLYWETKDSEDYQEAMLDIITYFFTEMGAQ
ncbi:GmrSD restriction endonuclease domain-containing protein [Psychrobacter faecalis]|uniref:GmrSD restriction endonuclease domain-containing protein n=1 Tax=Psychrobacter faecalis TaxID=180588 RepID=UPI003FD0A7BA